MTQSIHYFLALATLCCLQFSIAQSVFSFPSPVSLEDDTFENYAFHDQPNWHDFRTYANHGVYGKVGTYVGRLRLGYEEQETPYRLHDQGNCTATILSERLLLTNAHCVYSPLHVKTSPYAQETKELRLISLSLEMNAHEAGASGDVYPVKIEPVEINERLDFAILEFAAASPYSTYGAVDLSKHRSAQVGEPLFMIHHSNITGYFDGNNYKRITESNCARLNARQLQNINIPILMPNAKDTRPVNSSHDVAHFCDSAKGSSGSLLYARSDSAPVGLHFSGHHAQNEADRFNLYIEIEVLCRESRVLQRFCGAQQNQQDSLIRTADELVRRARQGGTLRLAAGTFRLNSSLVLSGDVRLIGQGYEQTRIVSSAGEYVVRYTGGGTFAAQGVGFEHTGNQKAVVVKVDNGTLDIDGCQFTGAKRTDWGGNGLEIAGSTRGTVRNSLFNDNGLHGIQVNENAQPRLEQNRLHDNTQTGIAYFGSAGGSAVGNESYGNGLHGIEVKDNAQPRLEQNRLHDNTQTGIAYLGSAGGSAVGNESYGNGLSGINVQDNAQPRLEQNEAYNNKYHGIQIIENAQPRLEQNRLHDNTQAGIAYGGSAGGSAVGNESYGNGSHGIGVQGNAQPRLEQNRLHNNTQDGISYLQQSGGSARNNQSYNNGLSGIYVESTANPSLSNNTTYGNQDGNVVDER